MLRNTILGAGTQLKANSVVDDSQVGAGCDVGPYARLRPGTVLADKAKVGNFVETKKAVIGPGSKVNHLSYIGDAHLGERVNVGAGTITCNYDGANKHQTTIGNDVFIGTNCSLVAPLTIGNGATTGAGSTVAKSVPDNALAIVRGVQKNLNGWKRPEKKPK
jgi:bifunctional UDP-N-acetylglucosamine pyrophosphorylase/glucosamine-1-phosphate N-acetyltransferase